MAFIDAGNGHALVFNFKEDTDIAHIADASSHYSTPIVTFDGQQVFVLTSNGDYAKWNLGGAYSTIRFSIGLYCTAPPGTAAIFKLYDSTTQQVAIFYAADGTVTVTGSSQSFYMAPGMWHTLEGEVTINNTTGSWIVRLDGVEKINQTGIDTQSSGAAQATVVQLGASAQNWYGPYYRHLALWTTSGVEPTGWMGDIKIDWRQPNAAGSSAQFTPSAGANYTCVDESPPSDSDYIEDSTVGHKDFYTIPSLSIATGQVFAVIRVSRARKTDAGTGSIRQNVKASGTEGNGGDIALTTNDVYYRTAFPTNPNTAAAWAIAEVNAMEIGSEIRA